MNAYLCGAARRTRSRVRRVRSLDVAGLRAAAPGHGPAPHMRTVTGSAERGVEAVRNIGLMPGPIY